MATVILVCYSDHFIQRYYGVSLPFGNDTFKPENMGYLSVEQALADYAVLIQYLKKEYSLNRVIAVGGRYVYPSHPVTFYYVPNFIVAMVVC